MTDEIMIEGFIYHGPGCCPECFGPLAVIDSEATIMELNQAGQPVSEETVTKIRATCMHCYRKQDMMRWKGGYVPYGRSSYILKTMEMRDEIEQRVKNINDKAKDENPFAL